MAGLTDLEARIRILEDIEAIRKLKFKHWRSFDDKLWDKFAECFTEDVVLDVPPSLKIQGRKPFVQLVSEYTHDFVTAHQGHQSEIEITSDTTAKGIWALRDHLIDLRANTATRGRGYLEEELVKEKGGWKIRSIKVTYIVTEGQKRGYGTDLALWSPPQG